MRGLPESRIRYVCRRSRGSTFLRARDRSTSWFLVPRSGTFVSPSRPARTGSGDCLLGNGIGQHQQRGTRPRLDWQGDGASPMRTLRSENGCTLKRGIVLSMYPKKTRKTMVTSRKTKSRKSKKRRNGSSTCVATWEEILHGISQRSRSQSASRRGDVAC